MPATSGTHTSAEFVKLQGDFKSHCNDTRSTKHNLPSGPGRGEALAEAETSRRVKTLDS